MVGWHHQLDGHEFEQTLGVGDGQGSLACCSPWGHKESDTTEQLDWTELREDIKSTCRYKVKDHLLGLVADCEFPNSRILRGTLSF